MEIPEHDCSYAGRVILPDGEETVYFYEEELEDGTPLAITAGTDFFVSWRGM